MTRETPAPVRLMKQPLFIGSAVLLLAVDAARLAAIHNAQLKDAPSPEEHDA